MKPTRLAEEGAEEIDVVVNIGKVLSGEWEYVEKEIGSVVGASHERGAIVKVIFENDLLSEDAAKIELCRVCTKCGADYVKTSTGYGFVKGDDGKYSYKGSNRS